MKFFSLSFFFFCLVPQAYADANPCPLQYEHAVNLVENSDQALWIRSISTSLKPDPEVLSGDLIEVVEAQVKKVSYSAGPLHFQDQTITIKSENPTLHIVGAEMILFSRVLSIGETIAVKDIGSAPLSCMQLIDSTVKQLPDIRLRRLLDSAESVVIGKVTGVHAGPSEGPVRFGDPNWMIAKLEVYETLKGAGLGSIDVAFPGSTDSKWAGFPRFHQGQSGIWILRGSSLYQSPAAVAPSGSSFHDVSNAETIRRFLKSDSASWTESVSSTKSAQF